MKKKVPPSRKHPLRKKGASILRLSFLTVFFLLSLSLFLFAWQQRSSASVDLRRSLDASELEIALMRYMLDQEPSPHPSSR